MLHKVGNTVWGIDLVLTRTGVSTSAARRGKNAGGFIYLNEFVQVFFAFFFDNRGRRKAKWIMFKRQPSWSLDRSSDHVYLEFISMLMLTFTFSSYEYKDIRSIVFLFSSDIYSTVLCSGCSRNFLKSPWFCKRVVSWSGPSIDSHVLMDRPHFNATSDKKLLNALLPFKSPLLWNNK